MGFARLRELCRRLTPFVMLAVSVAVTMDASSAEAQTRPDHAAARGFKSTPTTVEPPPVTQCTVRPKRALQVLAPAAVIDKIKLLSDTLAAIDVTVDIPTLSSGQFQSLLVAPPDQLVAKLRSEPAQVIVVLGSKAQPRDPAAAVALGVVYLREDEIPNGAAVIDAVDFAAVIEMHLSFGQGRAVSGFRVAADGPSAQHRFVIQGDVLPWNSPEVSSVQLGSSGELIPCKPPDQHSLYLPVVVRVEGSTRVAAADIVVSVTGLDAVAPPVTASSTKGTTTPAKDDGDGSTMIFLVAALVALAAIGGYGVVQRSRVRPAAGTAPQDDLVEYRSGVVTRPPALTLPSRYREEPAVEHLPLAPPAPGWTAAIPGGSAVRASDLGLLRVVPHLTSRGRSWSLATTRWLMASGWVEKVPGKGEDAEPAMRVHESGCGLVAVFDGTGGAGSASARRLVDGSDLSGAYVASRLAREVTESWFTDLVRTGGGRPDPAELQDRLARALRDETTYPDVPRSAVKGRLQRVLPTTMAGLAFVSGGDQVQVEALWAGDSRCYALSPAKGLQVLTIDDTRETDALELIRNDQPMSNMVCADRPFTINRLGYRLDQPVVLLTATDGCFGYVSTPAHFEHLMLNSLAGSAALQDWADALVESLAAIASDDCSFSLVAVGFRDFEQLRDAMSPRGTALARDHWAPFKAAENAAQVEGLRVSSWERYRTSYHELALQEVPR